MSRLNAFRSRGESPYQVAISFQRFCLRLSPVIDVAEELSRLNRRDVPSSGSDEDYTAKSEPAPQPAPQPVTPQPKAENTTPQPAPTPVPSTEQTPTQPTATQATPAPSTTEPNPNPAPRTSEAAPQSTPTQSARPLPQTASLLPLLGLVSFTLLGAALALRLALRS